MRIRRIDTVLVRDVTMRAENQESRIGDQGSGLRMGIHPSASSTLQSHPTQGGAQPGKCAASHPRGVVVQYNLVRIQQP